MSIGEKSRQIIFYVDFITDYLFIPCFGRLYKSDWCLFKRSILLE